MSFLVVLCVESKEMLIGYPSPWMILILSVLKVGRKMHEPLGYRVLCVSDPNEALLLAAQHVNN